jgi:hypothetical protein
MTSASVLMGKIAGGFVIPARTMFAAALLKKLSRRLRLIRR